MRLGGGPKDAGSRRVLIEAGCGRSSMGVTLSPLPTRFFCPRGVSWDGFMYVYVWESNYVYVTHAVFLVPRKGGGGGRHVMWEA